MRSLHAAAWWAAPPSSAHRAIVIGADPTIELEVTDVRPVAPAPEPAPAKTLSPALKAALFAGGAVGVAAVVLLVASRR